MVAILDAFPVELIGLLGDAFQVTADGPEGTKVAKLKVFNLPLILLKRNNPVLDVTLAHLRLYVLIADLIHHEHAPASHRQADVLLFLLLFPLCRLLRQILQLHQPLFILFIFFLDLVTDEAHVLSSPNHGQLVRNRSCARKHIGFLILFE